MPEPAWTAVLWLVALLALLPLAWWLRRRMPAALRGGVPGSAQLVGHLALSPQQRIVTVEVGQGEARRWLVLGVTEHNIRTLHTLDAPPPAGPSQDSPGPTFAQWLGRARASTGAGDAG
jgi:flagellar protein FliO/FliZ